MSELLATFIIQAGMGDPAPPEGIPRGKSLRQPTENFCNRFLKSNSGKYQFSWLFENGRSHPSSFNPKLFNYKTFFCRFDQTHQRYPTLV